MDVVFRGGLTLLRQNSKPAKFDRGENTLNSDTTSRLVGGGAQTA